MLKRAFSTLACMEADCTTVLEACKQYAIDGIEVRMDDRDAVLGAKSEEELLHLAKKVRESNLVICDLASNIFLNGYQKEEIERGKATINAAYILGVLGIRIFLGKDASLSDYGYAGMTRALRELAEYAKERKAELWIETHGAYSTGKDLRKLLDDTAKENIKIIWDIAHPIEMGETLCETWELIGRDVAHVHIKDAYRKKENAEYYYTELGDGAIPNYSVLELLKQHRFSGFVSFEWESKWRKELQQYDNGINYVLKQYTDYFADAEQNLFSSFTSVLDRGTEENRVWVRLADDGQASNRITSEMIKTEDGKQYRISVPFAEPAKQQGKIYANVILRGENGERAVQLSQSVPERLEAEFTANRETSAIIEVGVTDGGNGIVYRPMCLEVKNKI